MKNFFDVFISYGRADSKAFATKLNEKFASLGLNVWFDQEDIPLGVDYQEQINDGIEKAYNFIFVIAPHSVNSPYCLKEIELAIKLNKRIIPLLHVEQISQETWQERNPSKTESDWQEYQSKGLHSSSPNMHPTISKINWVYFREDIDDFDFSFDGLMNVISKHQDYVAKHTNFLVKALDWERNQKQTNYLLIGQERQKAEAWLKYKFTHEQPPVIPTDLHCEFISESIKNANNLMTQVFLSSSDKDNAIKDKIGKTLMRESFTIWTNKTDIKTGTAFGKEINKGIEWADNLVYLMSSDSLKSKYCQQELAHAFANNKRIIPLLIEETDIESMPPQLQELQFIDLTGFEDDDKYHSGIDKLLKELKTDTSYYESHKVLLVKALKWQEQNCNPSILLRGYNLQHFEAWLKVAKQRKEYPPLPIQEEFINASLNQPKASSLEVFISYSRADSDLARKLNESLIELGKLTWFDQESISSGEDFQQEIYRGIETSDNFLFLISPKSVNSPYCSEEVEYAQKLNKRIITILYQKVEVKDLHPALAKVQWLDFRNHGGDFVTNFTQLVRTLDTDREHVHNHSKWLQRAKEWENSQKNADLLLRGSKFVHAQTWLKQIEEENKQPPATELQKEFIQASQTAIEVAETAEKHRQEEILQLQTERIQEAEKRLEQEKKNARRQKQWLVVVSLLGGVATLLGLMTASEYRKAALSEIVAVTRSSEASFVLNEQLEALTLAINGKQLETYLEQKPFAKIPLTLKKRVEEMLKVAVYGITQANIFSGHYGDVFSVKFSLDGEIIASASADNTIKLWKRDGSLLVTFDQEHGGHNGIVNAVAFSPDGQLLVSASVDNTIKLWKRDGKLWTLEKTIEGNKNVNTVVFSPDGQQIASGHNDTTIKLWNRDGTLLKTLKGHQNHVYTVAFSPDGQWIASGSKDKTIKIWKRDGTLFRTLERDGVRVVVFSPDSKLIASGSEDKTIKIWKLDDTSPTITFSGHEEAIYGLTFTPDGQQIVSGSYDKTVRIWKLDGTLLMTLRGHSDSVNTVDVHLYNKNLEIASGSDDNQVRLWKPYSQLVKTLFGHSDIVSAVDVNADVIVSGSLDKTIKIWRRNGTLLRTLRGHNDFVTSVKISPNGQFIVSGSLDGTVKIWRLDGTLLNTLKGDNSGINDLAISPNGKLIISGSRNKKVTIWRLDGTLINTLVGHTDLVKTVAMSMDGKFIASGSADNNIKIWRIDGNGTLLSMITLKGHLSSVLGVDFSPDGRMLVSGGGDNTIKLWKTAENGQWLPSPDKTIQGHSNSVLDVKFSPDGRQISSASADDTIKIWQLDGTLITLLPGFGANVNAINFSQDGNTLVSGSDNKTVMIWDLTSHLTPEDLQRHGCNWLNDYLQYNSGVKKGDRSLCKQ